MLSRRKFSTQQKQTKTVRAVARSGWQSYRPMNNRYDRRFLVLITTLTLMFAQAKNAEAIDRIFFPKDKDAEAQQWNVTEISFSVEARIDEPVDVSFSATFSNDSDISIDAPGFYNDDNQYLIRFTPPTPGKWRYVTQSTHPELSEKRGVLNVDLATEDHRGGIVIAPNAPREFRYENGDGYYPIAFECDWLFALDANNASDIPNTRKLVDRLADSGFNQVVMNVFAFDVNWKKDDRLDPKYDYGSPSVFPFEGTNESPDHSRLNINYFKRLDRVIEYLEQKGIVAHLMIYVWNKRVNWPESDSESDNRYFDYVVKRYQSYPNLVWDVSKEALGYGHTDVTYIHKRIERLRKLDAFKRLITVHDYGYCSRFQENVDFVSVQLWNSELHSVMRNVIERIQGKPILNIEHGGYERGPYVVFTGNYTSPEVCLERAWQCVFAGTYPTHYWQGAAWNVVIADVDSLEQKDQPRLGYYRHMRDFVDDYKVGRLTAGEKHSNAGFCLNDGKGLFLYYVPKECDFFGLRLPKQYRGQTMTVHWFDPLTGKSTEPVEREITQWPSFEKQYPRQFAILIVKVKSE